mgnify:FL=1|tara:strand:- start:3511 stop:3837 length:327 start_codon:yes stop_codon:yes gene_type:complete
MFINNLKKVLFKVENFCGQYPVNYTKVEIGNDPNFVFENDPGFNAVQLWDSEGNTIFVNSFLECEHYVSGGWDGNPLLIAETNLQTILLGTSLLLMFIWYFLNKKYEI